MKSKAIFISSVLTLSFSACLFPKVCHVSFLFVIIYSSSNDDDDTTIIRYS